MAAWDITWKDLRLLAGDKRALVLLLLLPLMFIAILGMSTGQFLTGGGDERKLKIAVVDNSDSEYSRDLIKTLSTHADVVIQPYETQTTARTALEKNQAAVLLTIAANYETLVDDLRMPDILDTTRSPKLSTPEMLGLTFESRSVMSGEGIAKALVYGDALRTVSPVVARTNALTRRFVRDPNNPPDDAVEEDAAAPEAEVPAVPQEPVAVAANKTESADKIYLILVPGFTVMFVFFMINIMARSFIAERDQGTLRRLQLAPVSSAAILIGKTLPFYLTSVLQTSLLFLCGRLLFGMSWGPEPIYLIPVILCTSLAATSLGLLLATSVHTDQQVSAYGTSLVLVLGGISGCLFPRVWLPAMMRKISLATPHAWSLEAFDAVLTRTSVDQMFVLDSCAMLMAFAAAFYLAGWWRFRTVH